MPGLGRARAPHHGHAYCRYLRPEAAWPHGGRLGRTGEARGVWGVAACHFAGRQGRCHERFSLGRWDGPSGGPWEWGKWSTWLGDGLASLPGSRRYSDHTGGHTARADLPLTTKFSL
jgi:hypothetical protein